MENYYHFHFFSGVAAAAVHADDSTETTSDIFLFIVFSGIDIHIVAAGILLPPRCWYLALS